MFQVFYLQDESNYFFDFILDGYDEEIYKYIIPIYKKDYLIKSHRKFNQYKLILTTWNS